MNTLRCGKSFPQYHWGKNTQYKPVNLGAMCIVRTKLMLFVQATREYNNWLKSSTEPQNRCHHSRELCRVKVRVAEVICSGNTDQNVPLREGKCTTKGKQQYPISSSMVDALGTVTINGVR